jgi:DNA polymerase III delta prime subunit
MDIPNPPPHMLFFEPLDDRKMIQIWNKYRETEKDIEFHEIDAAVYFSVEEFGKMFELWVTSKSMKRVKLLMVWHAHFLSLACQQSLRRLLETKSFKTRVWFHVEYMNNIQNAIISRCIVKQIREEPTNPEIIIKTE